MDENCCVKKLLKNAKKYYENKDKVQQITPVMINTQIQQWMTSPGNWTRSRKTQEILDK